MNFEQKILKKLSAFSNNEITPDPTRFNLENILILLGKLENPQNSLKSVHIAGTNGKGSTAWYLHNIFKGAGYKTALYTSPHLHSLCERFIINGKSIAQEQLLQYVDRVCHLISITSTPQPSLFDILTAIAFLYFKERECDICIIEAGLGGRLDSTNVIRPLVSIITDISRDHERILGDDLISITTEKAGIIKASTPLITSNTNFDVVKTIKNHIAELNATAYFLYDSFTIQNILSNEKETSFDYSCKIPTIDVDKTTITINSPLPVQAENASLAITTSLFLNTNYTCINNESIKKALSTTSIPGRFETLGRDPQIIFDPAHNVQAIASLLQYFKSRIRTKNIISVFSVMKDKDYAGIIKELGKGSSNLIYFQLNDKRSCSKKEIPSSIPIFHKPEDLLQHIKIIKNKSSCILFTGSFRLYDTARWCSDNMNKE